MCSTAARRTTGSPTTPSPAFAIASAAGIIAFIVWELRQENPLTDLKLLKNPNFAVANVMMFLVGFILLGSTQLIPQFVQSLLGYTATTAGMVLSPGGFSIILLMPLVGRLISRIDARYMIVFGLALSAAALYHMTSFDTDVDYWTVVIARIFQAAGLAFLFIPISTVAYVGIPREKNNNASAIINLSRNLGGSIGIALLTTFLARRTQYHRSILVDHIAAGDHRYQVDRRPYGAAYGQHAGRLDAPGHADGPGPDRHDGQPPGGDALLYRRFHAAGDPLRRRDPLHLPDEEAALGPWPGRGRALGDPSGIPAKAGIQG